MNISNFKNAWLISFIFFSCSRDHAELPDFSPADLALLHYSVGDTLKFTDGADHYFSVIADSVSDRFFDYDTISDDRDWKTAFGRSHILYIGSDSLSGFSWRFSLFRYSQDYEHPETKVGFFVSHFPVPFDTLDFGQFNLIEEYGNLKFGNRETSHEYSCGEKLDVYNVNGSTYYDVFRIMDFNSCTYDGSFHVKIRVMYYSVKDGIIAFELSDGSIWFSVE